MIECPFMKAYIKKNWLAIVIVFTIVYIVIAPFLLTRSGLRIFDFTSTGQIGDTIGGITAPTIGLLSAILIYISFKEQYKANLLLSSSRDEENFRHGIELLKENIDNSYNGFSITIGNNSYSTTTTYSGKEAIEVYCRGAYNTLIQNFRTKEDFDKKGGWELASAVFLAYESETQDFKNLLIDFRIYAEFVESAYNVSTILRTLYITNLMRYVVYKEESQVSRLFNLIKMYGDPPDDNPIYRITYNYVRTADVIKKIMLERDFTN
jgi:hypothetical protein